MFTLQKTTTRLVTSDHDCLFNLFNFERSDAIIKQWVFNAFTRAINTQRLSGDHISYFIILIFGALITLFLLLCSENLKAIQAAKMSFLKFQMKNAFGT